jgi:integral membrane sensor domain MASE1
MTDDAPTERPDDDGPRRGPEPIPRHLRPTTLHGIVVALWAAVGLALGLGLASAVGAIRLVRHDDLGIDETLAVIGQHAGAWFVAAIVALGAIAVVEALLLATGHVAVLEAEATPPEA